MTRLGEKRAPGVRQVGDYRLSQNADRDVIDIYHFSVDYFGESQAERYVAGLEEQLQMLAERPLFGRDNGHVKPNIRRAEYKSHSIYYQTQTRGIFILRILHQRMDPVRWL